MLHDIDMRKALLSEIAAESPDSRVVPEMVICGGDSRVDIATIGESQLWGYEIKSDVDKLDRLGLQRECYDKTFDKIIIVVGKKYESVIKELVSPWWGIYVVTAADGGIVINHKREPVENPHLETSSMLELLWRDELKLFLTDRGFTCLSKKNKKMLRMLVVENISPEDIHDYCVSTLRSREDWRS